MKILEYPLVCWKMTDDAVFGQLVGTNRQLVADDIRSLKSAFSEYIEKKLKYGKFYEPDLKDAKMKSIKINVRPHYTQDERIYPVKESIDIEVQAVYGSNEYGYYLCFLPSLNKSFYFYNEDDLLKLTEHFSRDIFHSLTPSEIYSLLLPSTPWLESVTVKIPKQKKTGLDDEDDYTRFNTLMSIGEKLPYTRKEAVKSGPSQAWERGKIIDHLISVLTVEKSNVLLIGKSGVGKSAIIQDAVKRVHTADKSKEKYERHTFWRTTPARMTSKAKYLGEWQLICEQIVDEAENAKGILWVENFVMMALTGGEGPEDSVAAFLTSFIRRGRLRMVSELTQEQLEAMRRLIPGFVEHFRIIQVEEMDTPTNLRIFDYYNEYAKKNVGVAFTQKALETAYVLLDRFIRYQSFPGKAVYFLNNCINKALQKQQKLLEELDVIDNFSTQSGIPDFLLRDDILLDDGDLKDFFLARIKGQNHIIAKICSIIKVFKTGLNDPNKPLATMIFAGPTGVGKTATVKAISEYFFGMGQKYHPLIRLDMSEFQHPSQIYRLIGPDGKLIQHVREKPFSVVLFDEIEKANPLIFDALLTVLDEGILLDSAGRQTDFRNTIIIMTSNLGAGQRGSLGFKSYQSQDFEGSIKSFFKPEFFNRIDVCLVFNSLDKDTIIAITYKELKEVETRDGFKQRHIKLKFTDSLMDFMADKGFDKDYGARPLQREIERLIVSPLARVLMDKPALSHQTITVDAENGTVKFDL
jgi:ATP-dependent Clp protease ATP-binding subunit ClpC